MAIKLDKAEQEILVKQHYSVLQERLGIQSDVMNTEKVMRELFEEMEADIWQATPDNQPSVILQQKYKQIMDVFVEEEKQAELLYIIDKSVKFTYTTGYGRRTVRTKYNWYIDSWILRAIFESYYHLSFYGKNMMEYYANTKYVRTLHDLLGYRAPDLKKYGYLIAAELDKGNTNLEETLKEILLSENNTNIVTPEIIDGIVKSDNTRLHKVLGDFMLAARLQEGVRQVICETMDHGTIEAFLHLLGVIEENDLIRFSAVKRGICVWTGICSEEHMERITNKQLAIMIKALQDTEYLETLLHSNDSIELYMGLWAQGFYEVEEAISTCYRLMKEGTKNQKLVVSYYNIALQRPKLAGRVANQMLETSPEDTELCAAFLPTYMPGLTNVAFEALYGKHENPYYYTTERTCKYLPVSYKVYFESEKQARTHFTILKQLRESAPKKGYTWSPCIFPWYSVSFAPADVLENMAMIAYMLQDDAMIDEVCVLLPEIKEIYERCRYLRLLLHTPKTAIQRSALLDALADKGPDVRKEAYEMICNLQLTGADYEQIRGCLKYKAADIRKNTIALLEKQDDVTLKRTIEVALRDKKEEVRLGGLDLMMRLKKDEKRQGLFRECVNLLSSVEGASEKEAVIIKELAGDSQADSVLEERGYGLYNPDAPWEIEKGKESGGFLAKLLKRGAGKDFAEETDANFITEFMKKSNRKDFEWLLMKLDEIFEENKNREYKNAWGTELLLGENFMITKYGAEKEIINKYPFPELWIGFYEEHIKDFETLVRLHVFCDMVAGDRNIYDLAKKQWFKPVLEKVLGGEYIVKKADMSCKNTYIYYVIKILFENYASKTENARLLRELGFSMLAALLKQPAQAGIYIEETRYAGKQKHYITNSIGITDFIEYTKDWSCQEDFDRMFLLSHRLNAHYGENVTKLTFLHYVKAYTRGLITMDNVYQAVFDKIGLGSSLQNMRAYLIDERMELVYRQFIRLDGPVQENPVLKKAEEIYWKLTEMILKVELKRSEMPTNFSEAVGKISKIKGCAYLLDILTALGKDTLERSVYYSYYGNATDKKTCLCHLLHVSEPLPEENGETLGKLLKERKITDKRLVEVAMYNAKWIDVIEEYLEWPGLKSGVYYFTAHMNERFSEKTEAIIAKYTPLTKEELNDGAFDLNWFLECSNQLGEKRFQLLYDAAKYISDSNKHTRARKYADAVQGKVNVEELEKAITDKRNKDLLMSYPLIPLKDGGDTLRRYQFLQKFLKASKQFGAQRRASEAKSVAMAMQNLATRTGYTDVTRLTLNMETKLVEEIKGYFEWQPLEDVQLRIEVAEEGKPTVVCQKDGKSLKTIPAKLKKSEALLNIKEVCSRLKEQYIRTKAMMEQFMEDCVTFTAEELANLQTNPIIRPVLKDLVYITEDRTGFMEGLVMTDYAKVSEKLKPEAVVRIAHPFDLWNLKVWQEYQKVLFEKQMKQPFKQVFRELYIKTSEELEKFHSLRYAGNQIQPKKTAACLKGRRWVADYEDGLQKIYYKENIVARIYALADWFSPADVEAPTLEWVEFSDRKTFKPIAIKDVPDCIFSEVMRDVDLAVSVAHVGGVDPETSHSTMEMRKTIVEFNLPLFGLTNVSFAGNHAIIQGKRAEYTVHLGSGVVFKRGGAQIAVLPVHSQHRGKLFLPFVDEDPKTAEIMSKIVLFAEDMKIKDPYILEQIV